jgi:hypothetical protein
MEHDIYIWMEIYNLTVQSNRSGVGVYLSGGIEDGDIVHTNQPIFDEPVYLFARPIALGAEELV